MVIFVKLPMTVQSKQMTMILMIFCENKKKQNKKNEFVRFNVIHSNELHYVCYF